ncbi:hypothetical protein [Motilimonas eburnea]|uniref:hypothetical protein n=1 Tax=Motilimonas eburnea TaxID=1737488 RepID=UPI001E4413FA|nr:hypothetical protein [Motilimonas eburnea]MCE2570881.1 hypothetical protein [Motilimonas eburnea]
MTGFSQLQLQVSLLRQGAELDRFSVKLTLLALLLLIVQPWLNFALWQVICLMTGVLLGLLQKYYALRVSLDAELFSNLASELTQMSKSETDIDEKALTHALARLDLALAEQGLIKRPTKTRTLAQRCLGAKRLLKRQMIYLFGQLAMMLVLIIMTSLAHFA